MYTGPITSVYGLCVYPLHLTVHGAPLSIGTLPNLQHGLGGTLYMGQRMTDGQYYFRMENFRYDGGGPDAYVYVFRRGDTVTALRSGPGITIPLNSQ